MLLRSVGSVRGSPLARLWDWAPLNERGPEALLDSVKLTMPMKALWRRLVSLR